MASALIASAELALVIGAGAALGAVALMVSAALYKPAGGKMGKILSVILPPMLVAVVGPMVMDAIPGTEAGTTFGLIFALITAAAPLTSYAKAQVHKYASGMGGGAVADPDDG